MPVKNSIILCTYNESKYIKNTVYELKKNIPDLELIIVDDSSTDGTIEILKNLKKDIGCKIILRKRSRSLASAFVRGLVDTEGENIGWIDSNMEELAPKFNQLIEELNSDVDIAILSRYVEGAGDERILIRSLGSKYFNIFCRLLLRVPIKDLTGSIFLMKRRVLDEVTFLGYGHGEFFLEFLYNAYNKGFKIKEIPYVQKKDKDLKDSKSAPNLIKFFYYGFMYVLRTFSAIIRKKN